MVSMIFITIAGIGAQWWNFLDNGTSDPNEPTLGHVTLMLVLDVVLDVLITWYVSAVWPGKFGVPKPWYFLFTRAYWQPETSRKQNNDQGMATQTISYCVAALINLIITRYRLYK